jgi:arylamine N-acetyltransferase
VYVRLVPAWKLHCVAKTHHKSTEILFENKEKNEHKGEIFREENSDGLYFHNNIDNDVHDIDLADVCTSEVEFENIDVFYGNKIQQQNELREQ